MGFQFFPHKIEPGPPFSSTSADNGLSVDSVSGRIVLGQLVGDAADPGILLDSREIPLAGNDLNFNRAIDYATNRRTDQGNIINNILFGPPGGSYQFLVRGAQNDGFTNALEFAITKHGLTFFDDVNGTPINILSADNISLFSDNGISLAPPLYQLGDVNGIANSSLLAIDDLNKLTEIKQGLHIGLSLDFANNIFAFGDVGATVGGAAVKLDPVNSLSQIGDVYGFGNNSFVGVDDIAQTVVAWSGSKQSLSLDGINNLYQLGDWSNVNDGSAIKISDVVGASKITLLAGAASNGASLQLDDATNSVIITNTALSMAFNINGVAGFTGTVTPVNTITVVGGIVTNVA